MCTAHVCSLCIYTVSSQKTSSSQYLPPYSLRLFAYLYRPGRSCCQKTTLWSYTQASVVTQVQLHACLLHAASSLNVSISLSNCKHLHCHDYAVLIPPVLILGIYSVINKPFLHRQELALLVKAALSRSHDPCEYANAPNHSSRVLCMLCRRQAAGFTVCVRGQMD